MNIASKATISGFGSGEHELIRDIDNALRESGVVDEVQIAEDTEGAGALGAAEVLVSIIAGAALKAAIGDIVKRLIDVMVKAVGHRKGDRKPSITLEIHYDDNILVRVEIETTR